MTPMFPKHLRVLEAEIVYITNFIQVSQLSHMIREIFQVWPGETLFGSRD